MAGLSLTLVLSLLLVIYAHHPGEGGQHAEDPDSKYVDYYPGDANSKITLSCPHDGTLAPTSIPDRVNGCYDPADDSCDYHRDCGTPSVKKCRVVTIRDRHASRMALEFQEYLAKRLGSRPHLIVSRLSRWKMDPNRPIALAANHNPLAEKVYNMFHGFIQTAHDMVALNGPGLHIDVHGYTKHNADNWTEIGYNIRPADLNDGVFDIQGSSIRSLAERLSGQMSFQELVTGPESLGAMMQNKGYKVIPSPKYPNPASGYPAPGGYYRGGDITRKWGSLYGGDIDGIQIEFPQWIRDDSKHTGPEFGAALAKWIEKYY